MLNLLIDIVYGVTYGVALAVPGLSGATVAVIMGYYERLIEAFSKIFSEFKKHIVFLAFFGIGVLGGLFVLALLLELLLDISQIGVCFAIIGLVIGSVPSVVSESGIKIRQITVWEIAAFVLAAGIMCFLALYSGGGDVPLGTDSFLHILNLFWVGFVSAFGPVAPGLSGSTLLIVLAGMQGYDQILAAVTDFNIALLLPFGAGMAAGAFLLSILIRICLRKARKVTYAAVLGLVVFSVLPLYANAGVAAFDLEVIISIIIAVVVGIGTYFLTRTGKNPQNRRVATEKLK